MLHANPQNAAEQCCAPRNLPSSLCTQVPRQHCVESRTVTFNKYEMGDHIMFCFFATIEPPLGIGDGVEKLCRARNPTNGVSSCAIQMTREIYM